MQGEEWHMIVSTKGRYALMVMIDLANHDNGGYISLGGHIGAPEAVDEVFGERSVYAQ